MTDFPNKIQWHPAFYAAAGLELKENIEQLKFSPEYNLSKEPIRIDLLIIKDRNNVEIKNEIGHIMRKYNIIEYKSPEDGLNIDDFYKTIGYACLYKGYGERVNQIPIEELTVSLFREIYPRELFDELKRMQHQIIEKYPGIYYIVGNLPVPVQIIVTGRLNKETHYSLRMLSNNASEDDIKLFLKEAEKATSPLERSNIDAVLQVSISANFHTFERIRRDSVMCEALERLMKENIDAKVSNTKLNDIRNIMETLKLTAEDAMDALKIPTEERKTYLKKL